MSDPFSEKVRNAPLPGQFWRPEVGDDIIGIYYGDRPVKTKYGEKAAMKIEDELTKDMKLVMKTDFLKKEFERLNIQVGERIGLKYQGKPGKAHLWSVFVDRPEKGEKEGK